VRTLLVVVGSVVLIGVIAFGGMMYSITSGLDEGDPKPGYAVVTTELTIVTKPSGAAVYVDGVEWGAAPVTIAAATIGAQVEIRAELAGHVTTTRQVIVVDRVHTVELTLPVQH
jgi:hypothetical protein